MPLRRWRGRRSRRRASQGHSRTGHGGWRVREEVRQAEPGRRRDPGLRPAAAAAGEEVGEDRCDAPDGGGGTEEEEGRVAAGRPCGQGTAEAAPQSPAGPPASESRCRCYLPYIQTHRYGAMLGVYTVAQCQRCRSSPYEAPILLRQRLLNYFLCFQF